MHVKQEFATQKQRNRTIMSLEIDCELLITLVEARPILWDKTIKNYKNRNKTLQSWTEICRIMNEDYDELSEIEQIDMRRNAAKKWTNVKDSFLKWLKKCRTMQRTGAPTTRFKKYVYHDQLIFLTKVATEKPTDSSTSVTNTSTDDEQLIRYLPNTSAGRPHRKKRQVISAPEERIVDTSEVPIPPNRHMAFFAGILPSLENFDDDQICDFQIGVLNLIKTVKRGQFSL